MDKKYLKYIVGAIIVGLVILFVVLFLLNMINNKKKIVGEWTAYESGIYSYFNRKGEYKDCWVIRLNADGTYEERDYGYWPFAQECDGCVIGNYMKANSWVYEDTYRGKYSFNGKKLVLKNNEAAHHLYHTRELNYENVIEFEYDKSDHTLHKGIYTYATRNDNCVFNFIDPSGDEEEYKVIN